MIRDFTDDAKERLEKAIDNAKAQDVGGWWEWWDKNIADGVADWFIKDKIADYNNDINAYHNSIVDKKDTSKEQLNTIFENVYQVEAEYSNTFKGFQEQAAGLKDAFSALAEIFNPFPADNGGYILARPQGEFSVFIAKGTSVIFDNIMNQVVTYDEDGNPTYHWDKIEEILSKDPDDITEMEYYILATLYCAMEEQDVEEFILVLADKTGDVKGSVFQPQNPYNYTKWDYSQEKIENLQKYINGHINSLIYQQQYIESLSEEEIQALYQQKYPNADISGINFKDQKDILIKELKRQSNDLIQKNSLLTVAGQLSTSADKDIQTSFGIVTSEFDGLTGEEGAVNPSITVTKDADGKYTLTYCNSQLVTTANNNRTATTFFNNLNQNTVIIGKTVGGSEGELVVHGEFDAYFSAKYNYNIGQSAFDKGIGFINDKITGVAVEKIAKNLGESVGNKAGKVIEFIPIAGDVMSMGWELVEEKAENDQNIKEATAISTTLHSADYCNLFNLDSNIVQTGDVEQTKIIFYPSADTDTIIENFNRYLKRENVNLSKYKVDYPITLQDVYSHADDIQKVIGDMDSEDISIVFD